MSIALMATLVVFSVLFYFSSSLSKGSSKSHVSPIRYRTFPGMMTPHVMKSPRAWNAAHATMAPYFLAHSIVNTAAGVVTAVLVIVESQWAMTAFAVGVIVSVLALAVLVFCGDRVAAKTDAEPVDGAQAP